MKLQLRIEKKCIRRFVTPTAWLLVLAAGVVLTAAAAEKDTLGGKRLLDGTNVPAEVRSVVESYLLKAECAWCLDDMKRQYDIDSTLTLSDIEAGTPVHKYLFDMEKLKNEKETIPISNVVKPMNLWEVPIRAHGYYLYALIICRRSSEEDYCICGSRPGNASEWESVWTYWPESSGYRPIMIKCSSSEFLHFPQIDDFNLLLLQQGYAIPDSVSTAFDRSTGDGNPAYVSPEMKNRRLKTDSTPRGAYLSDSRRIFKYIKRRALGLDKPDINDLLRRMKKQ